MRFPHHLLQASTLRSEPLMVALAAVAIGMFVGTWVLGPAITHDSSGAPAPARQERMTFEAMVAHPDPMPYRAPTPAFDMPGPTNYAAVARDKARAELGGESADDDSPDAAEPPREPSSYRRFRYPAFDRHRVQ
jgi:hypothetical protein